MAKGQRKRLLRKQKIVAESMDVDENPERATATETGPSPQGVLKPQHDARIQKQSQRKRQPLRRNQRLRLEKGVERAEAVVDQFHKKIGESKQRGRKVKDRRHDWEDINHSLKALRPTAKIKSMEVGREEAKGGHGKEQAHQNGFEEGNSLGSDSTTKL